jgi:hypothetical protein
MIHMGVGDKDVIDLKKLSRAEIVKIPQVEEERSPLVPEFYIYPRIAEGIIDQMGAEHISFPHERII